MFILVEAYVSLSMCRGSEVTPITQSCRNLVVISLNVNCCELSTNYRKLNNALAIVRASESRKGYFRIDVVFPFVFWF